MTSPTARQIEVLRLLAESPQPTIREIAARLGITSLNGVADHIKALDRKGCVERHRNRARSIEITRRGELELKAAGVRFCPEGMCPRCGFLLPKARAA